MRVLASDKAAEHKVRPAPGDIVFNCSPVRHKPVVFDEDYIQPNETVPENFFGEDDLLSTIGDFHRLPSLPKTDL